MELPHPTHGDCDTSDALLVIVDSTGIPVLVRPYGNVQKPPSAAIGIVSAVFHAATQCDNTELRALRSLYRSIVYVQQANDFLLALAQTHATEERHIATAAAERMLHRIFHALQMTIGPSLVEMESSKLRGAVARQLSVIDYIYTNAAVDARLSLETPVTAVCSTRRSIDTTVHPPTLLYAMHATRDGIIYDEIGPAPGVLVSGLDLVMMLVIAQASASRSIQRTFTPIYVNVDGKTTLCKTGAVLNQPRQGECVLGVFAADTTESDLEMLTRGFRNCDDASGHTDDSADLTVASPELEALLPAGFVCCLVAPCCSTEIGNERAIFFRHRQTTPPSSVDTKHSLKEPSAWQTLSHFVWSCSTTTLSKPQRVDYKQEDERYTFVHCLRTPLSVYAVCTGHLSLGDVVHLGDLIASTFVLHTAAGA